MQQWFSVLPDTAGEVKIELGIPSFFSCPVVEFGTSKRSPADSLLLLSTNIGWRKSSARRERLIFVLLFLIRALQELSVRQTVPPCVESFSVLRVLSFCISTLLSARNCLSYVCSPCIALSWLCSDLPTKKSTKSLLETSKCGI